jgi:two-component system response regulator HydG
VLLCTGDEINEDHLPSEILYQPDSLKQATSGDLRKQTESQEREIILSTLEKTRYNKSKAAELLSIDRKTLYNKMKQYGIES